MKSLMNLIHWLIQHGFGDSNQTGDDLEEGIQKSPTGFTLYIEKSFDSHFATQATLIIRKTSKNEYTVIQYQVAVQTDDPEAPYRSHTFIPGHPADITFREAHNLLSGRSVLKTMTDDLIAPGPCWLRLDLTSKKTTNQYAFHKTLTSGTDELAQILDKYPILELQDPILKQHIIANLCKGSQVAVTIFQRNKLRPRLIEALPQLHTIAILPPSEPRKRPKNDH